MWAEVFKVALGSAGALLVSWAVFAFKDGGRRGAKRRAIREDLELIKLLDAPEHEDARQRIRARVTVLLQQYEPDADAIRNKRSRRLWGGGFAGAAIAAVAAIGSFELESTWASLLLGGVLGIGVNIVHDVAMWHFDRSEQDAAVEATLQGVLGTVSMSAEGVVSKPAETSGSDA
ncbi:hypothetical protein [Nocardioides xinjiangensis]|uniref:hypothetical protein n=1 Tax=Nocardioides xinjiangensis TaxID=2817376 RepID=UPI001B300499|nr:hypothetical protein [Nocardioides sp. SYSU D00514]